MILSFFVSHLSVFCNVVMDQLRYIFLANSTTTQTTMKQQVVLLLLVCCVVFAQKSFHNSKMYRLFLETEEQLQTLEELEGQGKIDVWSERMGRGMPVDVMCEAENCEHFSQQLLRTARHELIIDNVQVILKKLL